MHRIDVAFSSHLGFLRIGALVRSLYRIPFCFHLGFPVSSSIINRIAYRWIDAGIAPSHHTLEACHGAGWPSKTLTALPNWVDTNWFRPSADRYALRQELGIPQDSRCVVFVGRICPEKGIETLLRAFPHVRSLVSDARLVIVGTPAPGFRDRLNELLHGLDSDVRNAIILRPVSSTPEKYFAGADVACVPPVGEEPFGLTLLEAMACALPVIATSVGIFPQIIGSEHRDLLVSPDDHVALAESLAWWLLRPEACAARGQQLRERVTQHYGHRRSVDAYETILIKLVASPQNRAVRVDRPALM
jgi:mannosyltransferase